MATRWLPGTGLGGNADTCRKNKTLAQARNPIRSRSRAAGSAAAWFLAAAGEQSPVGM